jgi:hypothetical protein
LENPLMTIKVVHTATSTKSNSKYCPWMIDYVTEVEDKK